MELDGEPRGTANTVTDGQRIGRLEDMTVKLEDLVRVIHNHIFRDGYPDRETPGRSGNFSKRINEF